MKGIIISSMLMFCSLLFSQSSEGYWDNVRTTNETINLSAGKRTVIKSTDLPDGTTEAVFRISILDDNQKLASSLVSLLKSIPDPTGISQGSAGAVYLLSTISGDDKCKYAIFNNEKDALQYQKTGETKNACFVQNTPINKDAKLLSSSSKCRILNQKNLWFVFESNNLILKEKIVLEIVPWIDNNVKSGWNNETKKQLSSICQSYQEVNSLKDKNTFCGYFIESVVQSCNYKSFSNFLPEEKTKFIAFHLQKALTNSGEDKSVAKVIKNKAQRLFENGQKQEAIDLLQEKLISSKLATASDYNLLGKYYILTLQYEKALKTLKTAEKIDETDLGIKLNLAHAYVLTDDFKKAKEIHKRFAGQNISADVSWKQQTKSDFTEFEKQGINSKYFSKILKLLK